MCSYRRTGTFAFRSANRFQDEVDGASRVVSAREVLAGPAGRGGRMLHLFGNCLSGGRAQPVRRTPLSTVCYCCGRPMRRIRDWKRG
jgi:hypothetical protein